MFANGSIRLTIVCRIVICLEVKLSTQILLQPENLNGNHPQHLLNDIKGNIFSQKPSSFLFDKIVAGTFLPYSSLPNPQAHI
jgi:hypothetical protein